MASIEKRDNSIRIKFVYEGVTYRKTLMSNGAPLKPTKANEQKANRKARDIQGEIDHGIFSMAEHFGTHGNDGEVLTVGAQLTTWLGTVGGADSSREGYKSAINFWKPLADKPLRALRHSHILTVIATRPDLSGKTMNNYISVLREAMELAVLDHFLDSNPLASIKKRAHQKPPVDPFSRDEAEAIITSMREHYPEQIVLMTEFRFYSGLRTSELFALRWANVDLRSSAITILEANVRGKVKATKTNKVREVKLNSRALAAIEAQRKYSQMSNACVWTQAAHSPYTPESRRGPDLSWSGPEAERTYRRSFWEPTLKRLKMRYRRPYNTRHTYASMMLMAGMTPAYCAGQMGHSVAVFESTYAKWIKGKQDHREMARFEAALEADLAGDSIGPKVPSGSPEIHQVPKNSMKSTG